MDELKRIVSVYNDNNKYLFRGQNENYVSKEYPFSFMTSFEKEKCIPLKRLEWVFNCKNGIIQMMTEDIRKSVDEEQKFIRIEALLQHYGWRTKYLDLTKNIDIALFFAGYKYKSEKVIHCYEDCFQKPVYERVIEAEYQKYQKRIAYLYVFDMEKIRNNKQEDYVDLTELFNFYEYIRPLMQKGCLISNVNGQMNEVLNSAIIDVYEIDVDIITDYCEMNELGQEYVFPNEKIDPLYWYLLNLPRTSISNNISDSGFTVYKKLLDIPEYGLKFQKIKPPYTAYYSTFWICDNIDSFEGNNNKAFKDIFWYKCNIDLMGLEKKYNFENIKELYELLCHKRKFIIEFNELIKFYFSESTVYGKGIQFELIDDCIVVSELCVNYMGTCIQGVGLLKPRYYKYAEAKGVNIIRKDDDCKCNNEERHNHNLFIGQLFSEIIKEKGVRSIAVNNNLIEIV